MDEPEIPNIRELLGDLHDALRDMQAELVESEKVSKYWKECYDLLCHEETRLNLRVVSKQEEITRLQSELDEARGELDKCKESIMICSGSCRLPTTPDDSED